MHVCSQQRKKKLSTQCFNVSQVFLNVFHKSESGNHYLLCVCHACLGSCECMCVCSRLMETRSNPLLLHILAYRPIHTKDDNRFFHYQIGRFLRSALKINIIEKNNIAFGNVAAALAIVFSSSLSRSFLSPHTYWTEFDVFERRFTLHPVQILYSYTWWDFHLRSE